MTSSNDAPDTHSPVLELRSHAIDQDVKPASKETKPYTKVIVKDLMRDMFIGVYDHEKEQKQPVKMNIELMVDPIKNWQDDNYENAVCYASVVENIDQVLEQGHIHLVETLAETIAENCLADHRVQTAQVSIYKTDIIDNCAGVGVEILRTQS